MEEEDNAAIEEIRRQKLKKLREKFSKGGSEMEKNRNTEPIEINDSTFQSTIKSNDYLIVDCWAPWCGPCRMLTPIIDELAGEYPQVKFAKMNTDESQRTAYALGITAIPTVLFIAKGKLVHTEVGVKPKEHLKAAIEAMLKQF